MTKEEAAEIAWQIAERLNSCVDRYIALCARYDDAMKRIQDMQAELEFLRSELARKE